MGACCSSGAEAPSPPRDVSHQQQAPNTRPVSNPPPKPHQNAQPSSHPPLATEHHDVEKKKDVGNVLGRPTEDVRDTYTIGRELGRGQFGVTYLCTEKTTGEQYACKSIAKRKLVSKEDREDVAREVAIMHHLSGHPHIVTVRGAYEDKQNVHIVMELCAGGELFDRILARGHYSEAAAASLLRTIVDVVNYCHSHGVIHRDLKPENFLLSSKKQDAALKATDFGLSVFFKPGETFTDIVGSAYYVAPEVLSRKYSKEADVWSCGVILYILLCGVPPFWAENEQGIFDSVLKGHIDFDSDPWPRISKDAKDLVRKMLRQNPRERISAQEVLNHPWVGGAPDAPMDAAVLMRLKQFSAMNKMKKLALRVIASYLSEEEILGLKEMFKSMDVDGSGSITFEELKEGLRRHGTNMPEHQIREIMEAADVDNSGTIDYSEFITATMQMNKVEKEENLYRAFKHFDTDNSGYITREELKEALSQEEILEPGEIETIINEVDRNNDGTIDYDEFVMMMRGKAPPAEGRKGGSTVGPPKMP
eukprot:TRINITY_DN2064_c1_g1_i2.p1 TRINITY_DN2064_c1_g1~~TRINITY_DN2064_c1_g1_i2.p1  ORF type:complete len:534 (-),score=134.10 TRINITY_DN2064_c1_g1_i2:90-1691(-)